MIWVALKYFFFFYFLSFWYRIYLWQLNVLQNGSSLPWVCFLSYWDELYLILERKDFSYSKYFIMILHLSYSTFIFINCKSTSLVRYGIFFFIFNTYIFLKKFFFKDFKCSKKEKDFDMREIAKYINIMFLNWQKRQ